jgi:hypothetical protein
MASLSSYDDPATEAVNLGARLKVIEDQVRGELEARDLLYRLVAYKYLNASGLRVATVETEIRRELRRSGAN